MGRVHACVSREEKTTKEWRNPISKKSLIKIAPKFLFPPQTKQLAKVQVGVDKISATCLTYSTGIEVWAPLQDFPLGVYPNPLRF